MGSLPYCKGCVHDHPNCMTEKCYSCCMGSKYEKQVTAKSMPPSKTDLIKDGLRSIIKGYGLNLRFYVKSGPARIEMWVRKDAHDLYPLKLEIILADVVSVEDCLESTAKYIYNHYYVNKGGELMPPKHEYYKCYSSTYKGGYVYSTNNPLPKIKKVIFNKPATIVMWADGTKTVVKTQGKERFSKEKGLAMAIAKKSLGNQGNYYEEFKKWL